MILFKVNSKSFIYVRLLFSMAVLGLLTTLSSCSEDDAPAEIIPNPDSEIYFTKSLDFTSDSGEAILSFTTNKDWSIDVSQSGGDVSWCTVFPNKGKAGENQVLVKAKRNEGGDDRNVVLNLTAGDLIKYILVTQKQKDAITLTTAKFEIDRNGGEIQVEVKANVSYEVVIPEQYQSWIHKGSGSGQIITGSNEHNQMQESATRTGMDRTVQKFYISKSEEYDKREGEIIFRSDELEEILKVYQTGGGILLLSKNEYTVPAEGETIAIEIKSNCDFEVEEPNVDWITSNKTRSLSPHTLYYTIASNPMNTMREAVFIFKEKNGNLQEQVLVKQKGQELIVINEKIAGTLSRLLSDYELTAITKLKISGMMNSDDIDFINSNLPLLNELDMQEVDMQKMKQGPKNVTKLLLPISLVEISGNAFYDSKIESIVIPASVEFIGNSAFGYCRNMETVRFESDSKVEIIEGGWYGASGMPTGVFQNCSKLKEINIPASVKIIKGGAFHGCELLTKVTFDEYSNLEELEGAYDYRGSGGRCRGAFAGCTSLTTISIPKNVKKIGVSTFANCSALQSVIFESDSKLEEIAGGFWPFGGTYGAFINCSALSSISIPSKVNKIGPAAFKGCISLESVIFMSGSVLEHIGGGCGGYYNVPASYEWYYGAFADCTALKEIIIPSSVTKIDIAAFKGCTSLKTVIFENNSLLKSIEGKYNDKAYFGVFSDCTALTSIRIPANVESIGATAFKGCTALESVSFEKGSKLSFIEGGIDEYNGAFSYCKKMTAFDAENCTQLQTIGDAAFYGNVELNAFRLGTTIPPIVGNMSFVGISESAVLSVPASSITEYKNSDSWNSVFKMIKGL